MIETAHTPGPWRVEADMRSERVGDMYAIDGYQEYLAGWNITSDAGEIVGIEGITTEDPANARLIAAAPDLLDALTGLVITYDRNNPLRTADLHRGGCSCMRCCVDDARAALAKVHPTPASAS